jgi:uncharacterized membrane protein
MERDTARSIIFNKVPMKDNTNKFQIVLICGLMVSFITCLFCLLYIEKLEGELNLILLIITLYIFSLLLISKNYKNLTLNSDNLSRLHKKYYDTLQEVINRLVAHSKDENISVFSTITLTDIQPPETNTRKFQWALIRRILREDNNTTLDEAIYQFNNYISNKEYLKLIGYIEFDNNAPVSSPAPAPAPSPSAAPSPPAAAAAAPTPAAPAPAPASAAGSQPLSKTQLRAIYGGVIGLSIIGLYIGNNKQNIIIFVIALTIFLIALLLIITTK